MAPSPALLRGIVLIALATLVAMNVAQADDLRDHIKPAVEKSLKLIAAGGAGYARERQCFSCHHQALPAMTLAAARRHSSAIGHELGLSLSEFTYRYYRERREEMIEGKGVPGGAYSAGYALANFAADRWPQDDTVSGLIQFLFRKQQDDGSWRIQTHRPPLEDSHFTATALAIRGIRAFGNIDDPHVAKRLLDAQAWLIKSKPVTTEDKAFHLLGLHWAKSERGAINEAAQSLIDEQRTDGGWAQMPEMTSDAYATGLVLAALCESAAIQTDGDIYRRAAKLLLDQQRPDGSWHIVSRSKPFQTYFESGFPHGKDQFISIAASCWATMALLHALPNATPADGSPHETDRVPVFLSATEDYHTFRIPALVVSNRGTLLAFAEGRKSAGNDTGDIDVVLRRSSDGGRTWQPMQVIADMQLDTIGNPCPVVDHTTGAIFLLLTRNHGEDKQKDIEGGTSREPRTVWLTRSDDDGRSWSSPIDISATTRQPDWGWYGTGPGNGIQLTSGRLVVPCHHTPAKSHVQSAHVIYSDDHGQSWQLGGVCGPNCGESAVAEAADGSLVMSMRPHPKSNGERLWSTSHDAGLSWSKPIAKLADPGCQGSLIRTPSITGGVTPALAFLNPNNDQQRTNLSLQLSTDGGRDWPIAIVIDAGPAAYSSVALLPDGRIGCLYERGQRRAYETISFVPVRLPRLD